MIGAAGNDVVTLNTCGASGLGESEVKLTMCIAVPPKKHVCGDDPHRQMDGKGGPVLGNGH